MILLILVVGCLFFLCIGVGIASWAGVDMQIDGPDIKSIIMFIFGVGLIVFSLFCIAKASDYYHEKKVFLRQKLPLLFQHRLIL